MSVNAKVSVRQNMDPILALKWALHKLRRDCQDVRKREKEKEYFVSEARQRREHDRRVAFLRKAGK